MDVGLLTDGDGNGDGDGAWWNEMVAVRSVDRNTLPRLYIRPGMCIFKKF